jgi:hypothetical protein
MHFRVAFALAPAMPVAQFRTVDKPGGWFIRSSQVANPRAFDSVERSSSIPEIIFGWLLWIPMAR